MEDHYYEGGLQQKSFILFSFCILYDHKQPSSNKLVSIMQLGICHWFISSGVLWWHVSIGSATETRCGGICSLAEGRLTAACPHCRARYWYCGAFCKCERQRGRVLSDFFNRACAHGALCDLDSTDSHAQCLLRERGWVMAQARLDKGYLGTVIRLMLGFTFYSWTKKENGTAVKRTQMFSCPLHNDYTTHLCEGFSY